MAIQKPRHQDGEDLQAVLTEEGGVSEYIPSLTKTNLRKYPEVLRPIIEQAANLDKADYQLFLKTVSEKNARHIDKSIKRTEKENFALAFELIGGVPRLAVWAMNNQTKFYSLYARLAPTKVEGMGTNGEVVIRHALQMNHLDAVTVNSPSIDQKHSLPTLELEQTSDDEDGFGE